jgi:hypothetical protein
MLYVVYAIKRCCRPSAACRGTVGVLLCLPHVCEVYLSLVLRMAAFLRPPGNLSLLYVDQALSPYFGLTLLGVSLWSILDIKWQFYVGVGFISQLKHFKVKYQMWD